VQFYDWSIELNKNWSSPSIRPEILPRHAPADVFSNSTMMDLAFSSTVPFHLRGSATTGFCTSSVSVAKLAPSSVRSGRSTVRMLSVETGSIASEAVGAPEVVDIPADDDDDEFDESEIIPLEPPQPYINAQNIAATRVKFRLHETDTGSPEYQVATLTARIAYLTEHLKKNRKDHSSTRGLLKMVATRRRLLKWVKKQDPARFDKLVTDLNIRVSANLRAV